MSAFTGPQHKGAMRAHREHKRLEAQERQAGSKAEYRRRQKRAEQLLRNIFGDFETELEEPRDPDVIASVSDDERATLLAPWRLAVDARRGRGVIA